jgi:serine/threonine-protein kinase HipA
MNTFVRYLRMSLHLADGGLRDIGYLSQYGDILRVSFDDDYIEDPQRPTLSLSYRGNNEDDTRRILTSAKDVRLVRTDGRWPVFFQNVLPEGHNRDRLARERGCSSNDEFELLAAAGHDLMGALEVAPVNVERGIPDKVKRWHMALGVDVLEPGVVEYPVEDAASLPGAVTKFSAIRQGRRYVVKKQGAAGSVILKLPSTRHPDLVDNEYCGYQLCSALGLDCAKATRITREQADLPENMPFDSILAVDRFDRAPHGVRVHMEEFAQVLQYEPRQKYGRGLPDYSTMLRVLDRLSAHPQLDLAEFVTRFVAFILMGNTDAHLKNWALRYADGATPTLAPLYDPVCVTAFFDNAPSNDYAVNRAIDKTLCAFTWNDLHALLTEANLLRPGRYVALARQAVKQAQAAWPALLKYAPMAMRRSVMQRLSGGVALTAVGRD